MKRKLIGVGLLCIGAATFFSACSPRSQKKGKGANESRVTGWELNNTKWGGYEANEYPGQPTPIGMTFVQGGRFTMGAVDDELLTTENNNMRRTVSVSSFYMDETEVENVSYREYIYWLSRTYFIDYPEIVMGAKPDSNCWRSALGYNEPMVKYYFQANAWNHYPVVGVNWYQATDFCEWRSDRFNEGLLIKTAAFSGPNVNQSGEDVFTTKSYVAGQYQAGGKFGEREGKKLDMEPNGSHLRQMNYGDGLLQPDFRLPTEAEWEYAALGLIGNNPSPENKRRRGEEVITDRNTLPWGPKNTTRYGLHNQYQGEFEGNFMRGKGDYMGIAGGLNDNGYGPAPVTAYLRNAFGLYNMAGNVNEWVMDTYRATSHETVDDYNPFRGNVYTKPLYQEDWTPEDKDSIGHMPTAILTDEDVRTNGRYETRAGVLHDYADGDTLSQASYFYGAASLVNDSSKVYKGGSWADRAYWLSPGTRRYTQGSFASSSIGFRCVMDRMGSPTGDMQPGGNHFGTQRYHKR